MGIHVSGGGSNSGISKRVGEFTHSKSGKLASDGFLAVNPGTVVNGALDYPVWAAQYPEFVSSNDIVFPNDVAGMFMRNTGGLATTEGSFQSGNNLAHTHSYTSPGADVIAVSSVFGGVSLPEGPTDFTANTSTSGTSESRPNNRSYQLYTIVDTY